MRVLGTILYVNARSFSRRGSLLYGNVLHGHTSFRCTNYRSVLPKSKAGQICPTMSCIAKASWMTISDNAYRQLNQTERARASRYVKAEDIKNFVKALQANSRVSSIDHLSPRLSSITQLASQLHDDVFKLSESQNEVCTMVWITLGLGIEVRRLCYIASLITINFS